MTAAEYFAWEAAQPERHYYYFGEVFAMAGGSDDHNTIAANVFALLKAHLRGTPCRVFMSDMRLELVENGHYGYPDVFVTCDPRDATSEASHLKKYPKLVVEVLSSSTADYDLGRKFEHYRLIPTVEEILFIDPARRSLELYRRTAERTQWLLVSAPEGGSVVLESVTLTLSSADVREGLVAITR
jgi:Uma2 family endonuclease